MPKIALIHTSKVLVPMFTELCQEILPGAQVVNIADDSLIKETIANGSPTAAVAERLNGYIREAQDAGAEAIMVTCSSVGAIVDAAVPACAVPLMRVDQPMVDRAIGMGRRIGVLATVSTTLRPTADLVQRRAAAFSQQVEVNPVLCDGALEKLLAGQVAEHDQLVTAQLQTLMPRVDVVILAQASMARVIQQLPEGSCTVPVLSSPRLAIESLAGQMRHGQAATA